MQLGGVCSLHMLQSVDLIQSVIVAYFHTWIKVMKLGGVYMSPT